MLDAYLDYQQAPLFHAIVLLNLMRKLGDLAKQHKESTDLAFWEKMKKFLKIIDDYWVKKQIYLHEEVESTYDLFILERDLFRFRYLDNKA